MADIYSNLIAWFKFENDLSDLSGNSNNGSAIGSPTFGTGNIGKSLQTSSGNYVQFPGNGINFSSATTYTFSCWFKTSSSQGIIYGQTSSSPPDSSGGYVPAIYIGTTGYLRSSMFWHGGVSLSLISTNVVSDGNWHHVVDVYDNGTEYLYVDGSLNSSQSSLSQNSYSGTYYYWLGYGKFGGWPDAGTPDFSGSIDEVRIYSRALTSGDVSGLYAYTNRAINSLTFF